MDKSRELPSNLETKAKGQILFVVQFRSFSHWRHPETKAEETDNKCSVKFSEQKPDVVRRVKRDAAVLGELKRRYVDD